MAASLRSSAMRPSRYGEDMDPMASLANLADVMLVFACGLMLALITYWQIDISAVSEVMPDSKVSEIENPEDITNQLQAPDGTAYLDMGRVYMDPTTGKYYMIVDGGSEQEEALEGSIAAGPAGTSDAAAGANAAEGAPAEGGAGDAGESAGGTQDNAQSGGTAPGGAAEGSVEAEGD